ncbi:hypothetical protein B0H14DRAFT_3451674 [Mycena olivaceomarginata]|nr:hypothetical protein B0H14DRAFT_3451674 [Mycena olivaceomarginata]
MAITETQKSRTIRARVKNPPAPSKPRAKPGPKPKNGPRTAARFERDERRRDLTYHNWTEVFDYMEDNKDDSQRKVVAYFATRPDAKGGKLFFTQSALSKKLQKKAEIRSLVAEDPNARSMKRAWIVTCPEVDAALALWACDMEQKRLLAVFVSAAFFVELSSFVGTPTAKAFSSIEGKAFFSQPQLRRWPPWILAT